MESNITLKGKKFRPFISDKEIEKAVAELAKKINSDLTGEFPLFLVVLNGSFMFASDLLKLVNIPCEISFIKLASYYGTKSSGSVTEIIGLTENVNNRTVVILEDIVDTGTTIEKLVSILESKNCKQIKIATALLKPDAYKKNVPIDYTGISIKNEFVVGYGLDYDGLGRNLKDIYILAE